MGFKCIRRQSLPSGAQSHQHECLHTNLNYFYVASYARINVGELLDTLLNARYKKK